MEENPDKEHHKQTGMIISLKMPLLLQKKMWKPSSLKQYIPAEENCAQMLCMISYSLWQSQSRKQWKSCLESGHGKSGVRGGGRLKDFKIGIWEIQEPMDTIPEELREDSLMEMGVFKPVPDDEEK